MTAFGLEISRTAVVELPTQQSKLIKRFLRTIEFLEKMEPNDSFCDVNIIENWSHLAQIFSRLPQLRSAKIAGIKNPYDQDSYITPDFYVRENTDLNGQKVITPQQLKDAVGWIDL